jgi:hypothetical protein
MQIFQSFNAPGDAAHKGPATLGVPEKISPTSPTHPAPRAASLTRRDDGNVGPLGSRPSVPSSGGQSHE